MKKSSLWFSITILAVALHTTTLMTDEIGIDKTAKVLSSKSYLDTANSGYPQIIALNDDSVEDSGQTFQALSEEESYQLSLDNDTSDVSGYAEIAGLYDDKPVTTQQNSNHKKSKSHKKANSTDNSFFSGYGSETGNYMAANNPNFGSGPNSAGNQTPSAPLSLSPIHPNTAITSSVPEPSNFVLMLVGLILLSMNKLPALQRRRVKI